MRYCKFTQMITRLLETAEMVMVSDSEWKVTVQEINPDITALIHRSRTGRTVRITVICHDARLSGFDLEDRMPDQKSKQELNIEYRSG